MPVGVKKKAAATPGVAPGGIRPDPTVAAELAPDDAILAQSGAPPWDFAASDAYLASIGIENPDSAGIARNAPPLSSLPAADQSAIGQAMAKLQAGSAGSNPAGLDAINASLRFIASTNSFHNSPSDIANLAGDASIWSPAARPATGSSPMPTPTPTASPTPTATGNYGYPTLGSTPPPPSVPPEPSDWPALARGQLPGSGGTTGNYGYPSPTATPTATLAGLAKPGAYAPTSTVNYAPDRWANQLIRNGGYAPAGRMPGPAPSAPGGAPFRSG